MIVQQYTQYTEQDITTQIIKLLSNLYKSWIKKIIGTIAYILRPGNFVVTITKIEKIAYVLCFITLLIYCGYDSCDNGKQNDAQLYYIQWWALEMLFRIRKKNEVYYLNLTYITIRLNNELGLHPHQYTP
ncbi:Hypothetical_protein [Hexamita inflata]|uniref:Hypothetical_protein n=1 Tax=Hexamita inflata TaxID=28002 RepID=A0ABP1H6J8_9EUKA